jgi:flagellar biosynthesis/type III secretory pathway protein FliH
MKRTLIYAAVVAALLPAMVSVANAADKDQDRTRDQDRVQTPDKDQIQDRQIYGSQLMTQQERSEYRARMRAAKTQEEREQIRKEHHEQMKARAKEKGVTLPDEPPARGRGMGPGGGGMGPGMGGGPRRY